MRISCVDVGKRAYEKGDLTVNRLHESVLFVTTTFTAANMGVYREVWMVHSGFQALMKAVSFVCVGDHVVAKD